MHARHDLRCLRRHRTDDRACRVSGQEKIMRPRSALRGDVCMQFLDALVEVGRQNQRKWALRSEDVVIECVEEENGPRHYVDIVPVGSMGLPPNNWNRSLLHHSLPGVVQWLYENGKRDLVQNGSWDIVGNFEEALGMP